MANCKEVATLLIKCMVIDVFYYTSDMHMQPMPFIILCNTTDSSNKTQLICSTILYIVVFVNVCIQIYIYLISANRLTQRYRVQKQI